MNTGSKFLYLKHREIASGSFCLLVNSPWMLGFCLLLFSLSITFFNIYCWKGIHFSCVYLYGVMLLLSVIISLHFWFKDLIREFYKKYEVLLMILFLAYLIFLVSEGLLFISFFWGTFHSLSSPNYGMCPGEGLYVPDPCELTFANTLLLSNAAVSLGGAVVSLESSCSFSILFSLFSGILAWAFISLQIKEFRVMGFSINDSVYSSVFSLLTGLHFFHLVVGLFLLSLYYCSCSFHCKIDNLVTIRSSEVHLYYNLQVFYWHFLESLWLFIFLVLYLAYMVTVILLLTVKDVLYLLVFLNLYSDNKDQQPIFLMIKPVFMVIQD